MMEETVSTNNRNESNKLTDLILEGRKLYLEGGITQTTMDL